MKEVYLMLVSANVNSNKFYHMKDNQDGTFQVNYGRVGVGNPRVATYPISNWNTKYNEKIRKGYQDMSDTMLVKVDEKKNDCIYKPIPDKVIRNLVERLQEYAKRKIRSEYRISSLEVTDIAIKKAQEKIDELSTVDNSNDFNRLLEELFVIIPRRMGLVADYLSRSTNDFQKIIDREQSLLDTMSGQVKMNQMKESEPESYDKTVLDVMGLTIERVSETEKSMIMKKMGRNSHQYKDAYKVTNIKTQKKYDEYVNKHSIKNSMLLWHGSRLENWWNICLTGLLLRPTNVVKTGAMFGHGIYFAPKCQKSIGYTSISGAYWTRGNSNTGFLALFEIAANKPYDIYAWHHWCSSLNEHKLQKKDKNMNYVHAHAGKSLRNDEIIIYNENICTIKYLVEIVAQ